MFDWPAMMKILTELVGWKGACEDNHQRKQVQPRVIVVGWVMDLGLWLDGEYSPNLHINYPPTIFI
jgi:hypothetical protein